MKGEIMLNPLRYAIINIVMFICLFIDFFQPLCAKGGDEAL